MTTAATNHNEDDAIAKAVQHYIDGAMSGKGDDMKPAFHKDATIFGVCRYRPVRWPHPAAL